MARTLQTMLDERAGALVGRGRERAALRALAEEDAPLVAVVHGIAGIGKSALLRAAAADARAAGACVVALDGGAFEPTERGLLTALGTRIADAGAARVVLVVDAYERLRLLDAWLRQTFVPGLPGNVRVLLASRDAPTAWLRDLGGLAHAIALAELTHEDAVELLEREGVAPAAAERAARLAHGHPLSLQLAAGALAGRPGLPAEDAVLGPMADVLAGLYLDGLDAVTRRALDAASVVRRTTLGLLEAMLPQEDPAELFARLRALPFAELGADGLVVHDAVRAAASALLRAAAPARHRAYRRAAWQRLRAELRTAGHGDLWRYTADMLYLVEHPVVHDAFFPSGAGEHAIEPARAADGPAILAIARDPHVADWWAAAPGTFRVVRDAAGEVQGFSSLCELQDAPHALLRRDPVARACREHLRRAPVTGRVLLNRHAEATGRAAVATLWLDTKRAYLELRPDLRRLYVADRGDVLDALAPLGFVREEAGGVALLVNDFGPGSIDGWLGDVVGRELEAEERGVVDADGRRLVLDGRTVALSRLEADLLRHLQRRAGAAVTREELLREVWGHRWTGAGSNVVEVVVSGLRRKLGDRAAALETVRGVGYRLGPLD